MAAFFARNCRADRELLLIASQLLSRKRVVTDPVGSMFREYISGETPPGYMEGYVDGGVAVNAGTGIGTCVATVKDSREWAGGVLR